MIISIDHEILTFRLSAYTLQVGGMVGEAHIMTPLEWWEKSQDSPERAEGASRTILDYMINTRYAVIDIDSPEPVDRPPVPAPKTSWPSLDSFAPQRNLDQGLSL